MTNAHSWSPRTTPPSNLSDYIPEKDHYAWLEAHAYPDVPVGSWMIASGPGAYGHAIKELIEVSPRDIVPSEFDWRDPEEELRYEGRWRDVQRYAEWMRDGMVPPPILLVQTDAGDLRALDGHRRLAAADIVGVPLRAWVSWAVPNPEVSADSRGRPMFVGMTYELAVGKTLNPSDPYLSKEKLREEADVIAHQLREKYDAEMWLGIKAAGDEYERPIVSLSSIDVPPNRRGQGVGTAMMEDLIEWADANSIILSLWPSGDFGGSVPRLRRFYKRFGFIPNKGRAKDFRTMDPLIRQPKTKRRANLDPITAAVVSSAIGATTMTTIQAMANPSELRSVKRRVLR